MYVQTTTTSGEPSSKTYNASPELSVEFYHNGIPVKVSGFRSNEAVAEFLEAMKNVRQWDREPRQ